MFWPPFPPPQHLLDVVVVNRLPPIPERSPTSAVAIQATGLVCLLLGVFLMVGGAGFFGVDFWIALLLLLSLACGGLSALRGPSLGWGLAVAVPAAVSLACHLAMNFGFF